MFKININIILQSTTIVKMGQNHHFSSNPMFLEWSPHPNEQNTFVNLKNNEQVQLHVLFVTKSEELVLRKRLNENHNFILKIVYYEPFEKRKLIIGDAKYSVFTQKTYPLVKEAWQPVTSALSILKGFRRLCSNYGLLRVNQKMIRVNYKKQIKVWINQTPTKIEPEARAQNQQQMLADIVKIIMVFDSQTGAQTVKCKTINEAINNILHNLTENKNQVNLSNRTNKNEDKIYSTNNEGLMPAKNNFRSTKETEDDSLKPFNENSIKPSLKKEYVSLNQLQFPKNFLQNVTVPKTPTYINVQKGQGDNKPTISPALKSSDPQRDINYSQPNAVQKQSSIQFNNSHPTKMSSSNRLYKPVEHRNANINDSVNNFSTISQLSPSYERPRRETGNTYTQKYIDLMQNPQPYQQYSKHTYFPERKSNLNKHYLDRLQSSQQGSLGSDPKNKGSIPINQRSEINTSREFMQSHSFTRPRYFQPNICYDSSRTKTQQFYTSNIDQIGYSPRNRTNLMQNAKQVNQNSISPLKVQNQQYAPTYHQAQMQRIRYQTRQPYRQKRQAEVDMSKNYVLSEISQEEEKKQMKLKQAQVIKQEMSSLGILGGTRSLANDKSARDLMIRQRIQQKNKKHEELKSAMNKLLFE